MNDCGLNWIANFIWGITNEALSNLYVRRNYYHLIYVAENEVAT